MPALKLTNIKPIEGKTSLEVIKFVKQAFQSTLTTPDAVNYLRVIQEQGLTIPTYYKEEYSKMFTFDSQLVESNEERQIRLEKEEAQSELQKARDWYQSLPLEQQYFVNLLTRQYIPRG